MAIGNQLIVLQAIKKQKKSLLNCNDIILLSPDHTVTFWSYYTYFVPRCLLHEYTLFYEQHFYKQRQVEIDKKSSNS